MQVGKVATDVAVLCTNEAHTKIVLSTKQIYHLLVVVTDVAVSLINVAHIGIVRSTRDTVTLINYHRKWPATLKKDKA